ncbi:peptidoglycan DD-metalloendopeptidase family protein [Magnetovibrio sp. PR-2]|uniref:peptidoglycan DD-metalloendopeptidase family protein n=1 Tax=Magnetovibrio sp. PR-2 TaxID=3120356 RepID=UPI002FCE4D7E
MNARFAFLSVLIVALITPQVSFAKGGGGGGKKMKKDRVARDFRHADTNGDFKLSREEWNRRGNFDNLDRNGDGQLSLKEVRIMYQGHTDKSYSWPPETSVFTFPGLETDASVKDDRVAKDMLDQETLCGIGRSKRCGIQHQLKRGLIETGTGPVFPDGANCFGMDDYWAMDYASKRNKQSYHGGIDIPVAWGTPMLAIADGSVIATYKAHQSKRGNEVIVRHSPDDTGLNIWVYSGYGHLDKLPDLKIGQRVKMGDIIGPTGNSGIAARGSKTGNATQSSSRRPAIHLATWFAPGPKYSESQDVIIPLDGRWLDPFALYRQQPPYVSQDVKALPDDNKVVRVPVMFDDGTKSPASTKLIWPYACAHK